jgi:hypothetical protein
MKKKTKKFGNKVAGNSKKQQAEGSNYGYMKLPKGISVFKEMPKASALLDIIPYEVTDPKHPDRDDNLEIAIPGELWYKRPFKIHRQIGVNNETIVCPTSIGKPCPICDYRTKRLNEGAPREETDGYKVSKRNLYVVIPKELKRFKEDFEEKPHIWNISQAMFQDLLNEEIAEDEDNGVFPDLEEGLSLRIRWASKTIGKSKPFAETSRIDFEERDQQYDEDILKEIPDLDKVLNVMPSDQIERMFFELNEDSDGDDPEPVEEETSKKERKKKSSKSKKEKEKPEDDPPFDPDENECVACGGTGTNSKGRECKPCKGTGIRQVDDDEGEEEEKETKSSKKSSSDNQCPHDHEWAVDCEEHEECDDCDLWDKCLTAKEEMNA